MIKRIRGGAITCVSLVACLFGVIAGADAELTFVPDPGVRIDHAGLASPSYDEDTGLFYLYYEDERTHRHLVATSEDGLIFGPGASPTEWLHDPRVLVMPQPDVEGRTIYRRYVHQPDSTFISERSPDGRHFTRDEGIRYQPRAQDLPVSVYDHFVDSQGGIVLLYIGDMYGVPTPLRGTTDRPSGSKTTTPSTTPISAAARTATSTRSRSSFPMAEGACS